MVQIHILYEEFKVLFKDYIHEDIIKELGIVVHAIYDYNKRITGFAFILCNNGIHEDINYHTNDFGVAIQSIITDVSLNIINKKNELLMPNIDNSNNKNNNINLFS